MALVITEAHGAAVLVPATQAALLEPGLHTTTRDEITYVDWMTSDTVTIKTARAILGLAGYDHAKLWQLFGEAVARNCCQQKWVERTTSFLRCGKAGS
jgi:hypothetical protein